MLLLIMPLLVRLEFFTDDTLVVTFSCAASVEFAIGLVFCRSGLPEKDDNVVVLFRLRVSKEALFCGDCRFDGVAAASARHR